jgi:hypothetical protein
LVWVKAALTPQYSKSSKPCAPAHKGRNNKKNNNFLIESLLKISLAKVQLFFQSPTLLKGLFL